MKIQRIIEAAALASVGVTVMVTVGAASAGAATSGQVPQQIVATKIGSATADRCSVASVRAVRKTSLPSANPITGVPNIRKSNTVYVTLKC